MNRTIKHATRAMWLESSAPTNPWAAFLYSFSDAQNHIALAGCTMTPQALLSDLKPTIVHLCTFEGKVWARATDKMRKALKAKDRSGVLLRCLSLVKHHTMIVND